MDKLWHNIEIKFGEYLKHVIPIALEVHEYSKREEDEEGGFRKRTERLRRNKRKLCIKFASGAVNISDVFLRMNRGQETAQIS